MARLLRNEMQRMFGGVEFLAALILGCGIVVWHFFEYVYQEGDVGLVYPRSLLSHWIGAGAFAMQSYWYFMVLPLIAVMPYAGAFFDDLNTGYIKSVMLRCSRKEYFLARGFAVFFSGGFAVTAPLVLSLVLTALFCPVAGPFQYIGGPASYCIGADYYYSHPFLYTLLYLLLDFAAGGILALGAAVLSFLVNHKTVALLVPYGIYYLLFALAGITDTDAYSPNYFLIPGNGLPKTASLLLVFFAAAAVTGLYWRRGRRYEA